MAAKAWRCSQCGTVNEPGSRACSACGRWPSLFDLQDNAVEETNPAVTSEVFEAETFEPEVFRPEPAPDEEAERAGRFPRWAITAVWVVGLLVWLVVNALADSG